MIGWIANIVLIIGAFFLGYKFQKSFLFIAVGEGLWVIRSYQLGAWDMLALSVVFLILAIENYYMWRPEPSLVLKDCTLAAPTTVESFGDIRPRGGIKVGDREGDYEAIFVQPVIRDGKVVDSITWEKR